VTGVKKVLTLLGVLLFAVGAAFGGGVYYEMQKRRSVEKQLEEAKKKAQKVEADTIKVLAGSRGRTQALEAVLGVLYQNYGMAVDRVVHIQSLASQMGNRAAIDNDIDELMTLLMQQKTEATTKLLALADKMEPTPALTLPKGPPAVMPGAGAPNKLGAAAAPAAPATATPQAGATAPALPKAPPVGDEAGSREFQDGREALRQAKELLLSGNDWHEIVKKLARAQVMLDDSGFTELDDDLGAAIKAAKSKDEARVRTALEAALARLRAR
jgi:hypothetical protein